MCAITVTDDSVEIPIGRGNLQVAFSAGYVRNPLSSEKLFEVVTKQDSFDTLATLYFTLYLNYIVSASISRV